MNDRATMPMPRLVPSYLRKFIVAPAFAVALAGAFDARVAHAQPTGARPGDAASADGEASGEATDDARARARYAAGAAAFAAGRYREAIEHFAATARLSPNPALAYNVALAYDAMGETANALRYYRDYLRAMPDAEDRADVAASVHRLEQRLGAWGVQQITVLSSPPGGTVSIDDTHTGETPWTGELAPGSHRIVVTLPAHTPASLTVTLAEDRALDVAVELHPATDAAAGATSASAVAPPEGHDSRPDRGSSARPAKLIAVGCLGLGAGALGAAAVLERLRASAEQDARDAPTQVAAAAELDTIDQRRAAARVAVGVGVGLVATGALVLAVSPGPRAQARAHSPRFALACGPDACSVSFKGELR